MKKHTFVINLTFADDVTKKEHIKEIAEKIANSLVHTSDTEGIAPDNAETFTKGIEVLYAHGGVEDINIDGVQITRSINKKGSWE